MILPIEAEVPCQRPSCVEVLLRNLNESQIGLQRTLLCGRYVEREPAPLQRPVETLTGMYVYKCGYKWPDAIVVEAQLVKVKLQATKDSLLRDFVLNEVFVIGIIDESLVDVCSVQSSAPRVTSQ